jgi:hypothetical protein
MITQDTTIKALDPFREKLPKHPVESPEYSLFCAGENIDKAIEYLLDSIIRIDELPKIQPEYVAWVRDKFLEAVDTAKNGVESANNNILKKWRKAK